MNGHARERDDARVQQPIAAASVVVLQRDWLAKKFACFQEFSVRGNNFPSWKTGLNF